jgi:hypothetical protein
VGWEQIADVEGRGSHRRRLCALLWVLYSTLGDPLRLAANRARALTEMHNRAAYMPPDDELALA